MFENTKLKVMSMFGKAKYGYYFSDDNTLKYGDNRSITVGEVHSVSGGIWPCVNGLHAAYNPQYPLEMGFGCHGYKVVCWGDLKGICDKFCGRHRKYLEHYDFTEVFKNFIMDVIKDRFSSKYDQDILMEFAEKYVGVGHTSNHWRDLSEIAKLIGLDRDCVDFIDLERLTGRPLHTSISNLMCQASSQELAVYQERLLGRMEQASGWKFTEGE